MSCIIADPQNIGKRPRLVIKGASEIILESCTKFHAFNDDVIIMSSELRNKIMNAIEKMATNALRTLIIAYKDIEESEGSKNSFIIFD